MKIAHLKWILPLIQVSVAILLFIYGQHEFRVLSAGGELRLDLWPPFADRVSTSINYPTEVLMGPIDNLRVFNRPIYKLLLSKDWSVAIDPRDIASFFCVGIFWYFIGWEADWWLKGGQKAQRKGFKHLISASTCGLILGICCLPIAMTMMKGTALDRQMGRSGVIWSLSLVTYFAGRLLLQLNAHRVKS